MYKLMFWMIAYFVMGMMMDELRFLMITYFIICMIPLVFYGAILLLLNLLYFLLDVLSQISIKAPVA